MNSVGCEICKANVKFGRAAKLHERCQILDISCLIFKAAKFLNLESEVIFK